jgi:hypothetical protein
LHTNPRHNCIINISNLQVYVICQD